MYVSLVLPFVTCGNEKACAKGADFDKFFRVLYCFRRLACTLSRGQLSIVIRFPDSQLPIQLQTATRLFGWQG
jgi:hypothetical protein